MLDEAGYEKLRLDMVARQIKGRGINDPKTLAALSVVPRHLFVPERYRPESYEDHPLPIGFGQTISQPYMVALMTAALALKGSEKVLEVGTGSGYQAALIAFIGCSVVSIERNPDLARKARLNLASAGYGEAVTVIEGDGTLGLPAKAPFDAIIVTAGAPKISEELKAELRGDGGVLVMPVGGLGLQELLVVTRQGRDFHTQNLGSCRFVPLVGRDGW